VDFDLAELVEQTGDLFRATAAAKGVNLVCRSQGPIWVKGDPSRVQQIIANFTSNAVKFTGAGSVTLAGSRLPLGRCRVEVCDTGVGIDPDVLPRLFTAYTQADSSTARHFGGTGLGLAISRRLAEAMGGEVGAESTPGAGSCFWAELPLATGKPLAGVTAEALTALLNAHGQTPHVLLVEDTAASRMAAAAQIEAMGCHVETADNGLEALMAMAKTAFDAVVMDSNMPLLDGAAATRLARLLPGGTVPIIGLTAHSHSDQLSPLLAAGMDLVLTKPFRRAALHAALKPLVARRRLVPADTATATSLALAAIPAALRPRLADSARRDLAQLAAAIDNALANGNASGASMALHALRGVAQTLGAADLAAMTNFAEGLIDAVGAEQSRWLGNIIVDATAATLAAAGPALAASGAVA
jgi:CheY-like chemotaxis protein